ncbi:MAG: hypothetical protein PHE27_01175 [Alphaproteobacteria bacterium]|nr:hypothetical protein [Alphaproteobacteria bacterium]
MRFSILAGLSLILISGNAFAQQQVTPAAKPVIANYTCPTKVPCLDESGRWSSEQWAQTGNTCIKRAFNLSNAETGIIDDIAGVDIEGFLTAIPGSLPPSAGPERTPVCSILKHPAGHCVLYCELQLL